MAEMPTCSRCGTQHWRFVSCVDAPAVEAKAAARREPFPIQSVPDGYRVFGDRLETRDRNGWLIRKPE